MAKHKTKKRKYTQRQKNVQFIKEAAKEAKEINYIASLENALQVSNQNFNVVKEVLEKKERDLSETTTALNNLRLALVREQKSLELAEQAARIKTMQGASFLNLVMNTQVTEEKEKVSLRLGNEKYGS